MQAECPLNAREMVLDFVRDDNGRPLVGWGLKPVEIRCSSTMGPGPSVYTLPGLPGTYATADTVLEAVLALLRLRRMGFTEDELVAAYKFVGQKLEEQLSLTKP